MTSKSHDSLGRRKRLTPQSTGKRITLQDRDWLWLQWLHEHGPSASSFLLETAKDHGASEKRAKERLTDLFNEANTEHGGAYLTRPPQQFLTIDSRYNQLVYDIAPAGERALKAAGIWRSKNSAATGPWLHQFMVSSIIASVRLCTEARTDLSFIPGADILERANTTLSCPVSIVDPHTRRHVTKELKPDALFGLEYKTAEGSGYRFFVVEADRATEPLTSKNFNRKSALRNLLQYRAYVAEEAYKAHLKLTSPLVVLNVTSDAGRMDRMLKLIGERSPGGNTYMLFQTWEAFMPPFRPPRPNSQFLSELWARACEKPLHICNSI